MKSNIHINRAEEPKVEKPAEQYPTKAIDVDQPTKPKPRRKIRRKSRLSKWWKKVRSFKPTDSISRQHFITIRWVVLGGFWVVAAALTVFVLVNMATEIWVKIVLGALGIMWEGAVLVVVVLLKTAIVNKQHWLKITAITAAYLILVSVSFLGSIGFNIANSKNESVTVQRTETAVGSNDFEINELKTDVATINTDIVAATKTRDNFPPDYLKYRTEQQKIIDDKTTLKSAKLKKIKDLGTETQTAVTKVETTSEDIFRSIGEVFIGARWNVNDGSFFRNLLFLIMGTVLVLIIAVAAPKLEQEPAPITTKKTKRRKNAKPRRPVKRKVL